MENRPNGTNSYVNLIVKPGICGFSGSIQVQREERRAVKITVTSECNQIKSLASMLDTIELKELFLRPSKNPVYQASEHAKCHASCVYPAAILKAAEVALEMALVKDISMDFK